MGFRYSVFTVMTPDLTVEEVASTLRRLGYDGVEWRVAEMPQKPLETVDYWRGNRATLDVSRFKQEARRARRISEANDLAVCALGTYLSPDNLSGIEEALDGAEIMGCPQIRVSVPRYDGTRNYRDLFNEAIAEFRGVEELAERKCIKVNVEIHHGTICPSASAAYRFVSNFSPENIGVIFDPGNMVHEGYENWQLGIELLGEYISHVHLKDAGWVRSEDPCTPKWQAKWFRLGEGIVDWERLYASLRKVGYEGWLSFEDFSEGDTEIKLRYDLEYVKKLEERTWLAFGNRGLKTVA